MKFLVGLHPIAPARIRDYCLAMKSKFFRMNDNIGFLLCTALLVGLTGHANG